MNKLLITLITLTACGNMSPSGGGDITSVGAGSGLVGGATVGSANLAVDFNVAQTRVTGTCLSGGFASVGSDGSVTCSDPATALSNTFVAILGDSNAVGIGDTDQTDQAFGITTSYPLVQFNTHYSLGVADPPTWQTDVSGDLRPYHAGGSSGMGIELTLGRTMYQAGAKPFIAKMAISGSTLGTEWKPSATFPTTGGNLYTQWVARMHSLEASSGKTLGTVVISLGTNDATNTTLASAFAANMAAMVSAIKTEFGATTTVVWIKTNVNSVGTFAGTVRTQQATAASSDPTLVLVDNDDLTLTDGAHYFADGYLTLGQRVAFAALDARGYPRQAVTGAFPAVLGWGPAARGAGVLTPTSWPGTQAHDREYLVTTTGLADAAQTTPSGWTLVTAVTSTFTTLKQRISIYEREVTQVMLNANSGRTAPTSVPDTNNFNSAKLFTVRGNPGITPVTSVVASSANNAFGTTLSEAGITTTATGNLVLVFTGGYSGGANPTSVANSGLIAVTEQQDGSYVIGSDYQVINLTSGLRAGSGVLGASTLTSTASGIWTSSTVSVVNGVVGSSGITNSAANNVVTKSDGTNIVASSITDDGTTVATGLSCNFGDAPTDTVTITGKVVQNANNAPSSPNHASFLLNVTGSNYSGADGGLQVFQSTGYDTTGGPTQSLAGYFGNSATQSTGSGGITNYGVLAGATNGTQNYSFFGFAGTIRNDGNAVFGDTTLGALTATGLITGNNAIAGNSLAWSGASSSINLSGASASVKATSLQSYGNTQINGETLFGATSTDVYLYPPSANAGGTRHDINLNASGTNGVVRINSNTGGLALAGTGGFEVYGGANDGTANFTVAGNGNTSTIGTLGATGAISSSGSSVTAGTYLYAGSGVYAASGASYMLSGSWNCLSGTNANAVCKINNVGYNESTTQFRDLEIDDGKGASIAFFTGATKGVSFQGDITASGIATWGTSRITQLKTKSSCTAPTLTCGGSPTVTGCDLAGTVTVGTGSPASCIITFTTISTAPTCVLTARDGAHKAYTVTSSALTIASGVSGNAYDWICVEH